MIFVTLGTQDKGFSRLLKAIEKAIEKGYIKDEVIVQAGVTDFTSDKMKIYNLLSMDQFDYYVKACDLLITHGGVGSILNGLNNNKKVIAAARLKKYDEHESDHQIQIIEAFVKLNYIMKLEDFDKLNETIDKCMQTSFNEYIPNNEKFVKLIEDMIEDL